MDMGIYIKLAALSAIGGCSPHFNVPKTIAGDVPVVLVNDTSQTITDLTLAPAGVPPSRIVTGGGMFAHKRGQVRSSRGRTASTSVPANGELQGNAQVSISGATELHLGATSTPTAANPTFAVQLLTMGQPQVACAQVDQECGYNVGMASCCDAECAPIPNSNRYVCRAH